MSSPHSLQGKTVLIAGGAKNLGGLIATDFARHGAKAIAIHYNSAASKADAEQTVAAVQKLGAKVTSWKGLPLWLAESNTKPSATREIQEVAFSRIDHSAGDALSTHQEKTP